MRAPVLHVTGALVLACSLAGCAPTGGPDAEPALAAENSATACADWVPFTSVDHAAATAQLVVRAELEPTSTTLKMHGERAALHRATVTEVFVGDAAVGDVLDVVSTPASCTEGAPYPGGDPMLRDDATLVLRHGSPARGSADFVETITPYAGVWDERPTER